MLKKTQAGNVRWAMMCCFLGTCFCVLWGFAETTSAQLFRRGDKAGESREQQVLLESQQVIREIMQIPAKSIPEKLFQKAEAVAIFPDMVKGGFVVGLQRGYGVLVVKNANGSWENPRFATLTGGSLGFQAGIQSADVILILCSRRSVEAALEGRITVGADATVTAGPVGRQAAAETDFRLQSEIYSYSRSRGVFLGAAIDGSSLDVDANATTLFYQKGVSKEASDLVALIAAYAKNEVPPADAVGVMAAQVEATRTKLVEIHAKLLAILDPQWKVWLGLPPDAFAPNGQPPVDQLIELQKRFTVVKTDPKYTDLQGRPEFQETSQLLDQFISQLNTLAEAKAKQAAERAAAAAASVQGAEVPPAAGTLNPAPVPAPGTSGAQGAGAAGMQGTAGGADPTLPVANPNAAPGQN